MILDKLAEHTRLRVDKIKKQKPLEEIKKQALAIDNKKKFLFEKALRGKAISFICEVKKASPSKGIIAEDFPYLDIAKEYEKAGASAISVLTEPEFFLGNDEYLRKIAAAVDIPVLRKDFTIDEYQIYEAAILGASAVLLICAILSEDELKKFCEIADSLGLSCLVEAHDSAEIKKALACGARIIGVNNRDLRDFSVNINNSISLRQQVPEDIIFISESGIKTAEDIQELRKNNVQAALIGEAFMRSRDKVAELAKLYGPAKMPRIKLCGISSVKDVDVINEVQPDYIGFIFAPSRRQVTWDKAQQIKERLSPFIKTVGVFVDESTDVIIKIARSLPLDVVQLHGEESEDDIKAIKKATGCAVWKAVHVKNKNSVEKFKDSSADMLLLDTFSKNAAGGTGDSFDWSLLENLKRPFILAGGLSSKNIARAIRNTAPWGVDISSGIESGGIKDESKIRKIMTIIRRIR